LFADGRRGKQGPEGREAHAKSRESSLTKGTQGGWACSCEKNKPGTGSGCQQDGGRDQVHHACKKGGIREEPWRSKNKAQYSCSSRWGGKCCQLGWKEIGISSAAANNAMEDGVYSTGMMKGGRDIKNFRNLGDPIRKNSFPTEA